MYRRPEQAVNQGSNGINKLLRDVASIDGRTLYEATMFKDCIRIHMIMQGRPDGTLPVISTNLTSDYL